MINSVEIPMFIEEAVPEIAKDISINKKLSPYDMMGTLVDFTLKNIQNHNYTVAKRCFQIADKLYSKGNNIVKNAVQNVFVYSFTKMFQNCPVEKKQVLSIIPLTLYSLYIAQVNHSGC